MKTTLTTIAAALVMLPALAFAGTTTYRSTTTSTDGYAIQRSSDMGGYSSSTVSIDSPTVMSTATEKTVTKTFRNARSDTEYHANDQVPGEQDTRVVVRERVFFNDRNAE